MTDIIDLFLHPDNVEKMNKLFGGDPTTGARGIPQYEQTIDTMTGTQPCGMRKHMHDFIYGPYMAGLYDIWTGTDADLYLRHMNDEFIKYMEIRYQRRAQMPCAAAEVPSARVEVASYLNPFDHEREQARRVEMAQPRRPIIRGTGASMGGSKPGTIYDHGTYYRARGLGSGAGSGAGPAGLGTGWSTMATRARDCSPTACQLPVASRGQPWAPGVPPLQCACDVGASGARAIGTGLGRASVQAPEFRAGALTDELYSRWNRNQMGVVHMASRDDEASDVGCLDYTRRFAYVPNCADAPFDFKESQPWLRDPTAGSGEAQHHLLVLDSQMSVLNEERTIPWGYGSTEEQLADDARIAARYHYRDCFGTDFSDHGVIPKTNYKKLTQVIDPMGRVTLDDDRKLASDIMSRDSKGFILSGRR